jgi:hypothetical protein
MSESKYKPGVAFWPTVVVVVGLAYPASFGPVCWITSWIGGNDVLPVVYRPIVAMVHISESPSIAVTLLHGGRIYEYPDGFICTYATIGAAPGWAWRFSAEWDESDTANREFKRTTEWRWEWCDSSGGSP